MPKIGKGDVQEAVRYYRLEAGEDVALRFVAAYRAALEAIALHPGVGSPRYAIELRVDGLRTWPPERIELRRVLHGHRELSGLLRSST